MSDYDIEAAIGLPEGTFQRWDEINETRADEP